MTAIEPAESVASALTLISKEDAALHHAVIAARDGVAASVWEFGAALAAMERAGGYRAFGHATFRAYLESGDVRVSYRTARRAIATYGTFANVGNLVAGVSASGLDVLARLIEPGDDPEAIAAIVAQTRDMSVRQLEPVVQAAVAARNADPDHALPPALITPEPQDDPWAGLGATTLARSAPDTPADDAEQATRQAELAREQEEARRQREASWAREREIGVRRSGAAVRAAATRHANEDARWQEDRAAFAAAIADSSPLERAALAFTPEHARRGPRGVWAQAAALDGDERAAAMGRLVGGGFVQEFVLTLNRLARLWRELRERATPDELAAAFAAHDQWWEGGSAHHQDRAWWDTLGAEERAEYDEEARPQPVALPDAPAMVAWVMDVLGRAEHIRADQPTATDKAAAADD